MAELSKKYPNYGFEKHKGYGTEQHLIALRTIGPCEIHRKSFAPVKLLLEGEIVLEDPDPFKIKETKDIRQKTRNRRKEAEHQETESQETGIIL